jgi:sortase A
MTITDAPEVARVEDQVVDAPTSPVRRRKLDWRGMVAVLVVVAVGLAFLGLLFEGPVARQWYRTRQDHLASDLTVARSGVSSGQAATVVQAPRVGINAVVVEGDTPEHLRGGPGHRADTPLPGARGNAVVMGHRTGWGAPFANLAHLRRGDLVVARRHSKNAVVYVVFKVISTRTVTADDVRPLAQSTDHRLTLVTSAGGVRSTRRFVVTAVSGTRGRLRAPTRGLQSQTSGGSALFNWLSLVALLAIGLAIVAFVGLRRRHHVVAVVAVVTPLALLGALCVLLNLDLLLMPPLR